MPGPPRRKPGPGPWRFGLRKTSDVEQPQGPGSGPQVIRAPLVFPKVPVKWPEDHPEPTLVEEAPAPAQNVYLDGVTRKAWPNPDTLNPPDLIANLPPTQYESGYPPRKFSSTPATITPDLIANLPPNLYDTSIPKRWSQDELLPNVAANTPVVPLVQPQVENLYDHIRPRQWQQDELLPNIAVNPTASPILPPYYDTKAPPQYPWWEPPQILPYLPPGIPPPAGPTPAGRHHKRFKVFLSGRAVYFATRQEAETARDRHRDGLILEAKAAGIPPSKIKIRRPRITEIKNWRHPPDLAPSVQMGATPLTGGSEILAAIRQAEEEEVAIALLLLS